MHSNAAASGSRFRPEETQGVENGESLFLTGLAADLGVNSKLLTAGLLSLVNGQSQLSEDPQRVHWNESGQTADIRDAVLTSSKTTFVLVFDEDFHGYHIDDIGVAISGVGTIGDDPKCRAIVEGVSKTPEVHLIGDAIKSIPIHQVISSDIIITFQVPSLPTNDEIHILLEADAYVPGEEFRRKARAYAAGRGYDLDAPYRALKRLAQSGAAELATTVQATKEALGISPGGASVMPTGPRPSGSGGGGGGAGGGRNVRARAQKRQQVMSELQAMRGPNGQPISPDNLRRLLMERMRG